MCLYPKLIKNKRYCKTKKNKGVIPSCPDERLRYVTAACGKCFECMKQKGRAWQVRLSEEIRQDPKAIFVTLTISDESWEKIKNAYIQLSNEDCIKKMVRLFLERVRKKTKKSLKHWLTTERGGTNTERYHLHGLIWGENAEALTESLWQYGFVFIGTFVNECTVNYITKYITKTDKKHKDFIPTILCSAGIGADYLNRADSELNRYRESKTNETYRLRNGVKLNLPIYYRNKLYTDEEREQLFLEKIKKGKVWIMGQECDIRDEATYFAMLRDAQKRARQLHGDDPIKWDEAKYLRRLARQRSR
jgi:hypothetical protein